jgi:hypothetical protein
MSAIVQASSRESASELYAALCMTQCTDNYTH